MAYKPEYILILLFTIIVDYFAGILIERQTGNNRKIFLIVSLFANIGVLVFFKYFDFIIENINFLLSVTHSDKVAPFLNIILPIGLSFHTFQAMSYTIEVYHGNQKAERHFGIYALYVMFYPQLVAGPIERPQNLLHQFYAKHELSYTNVSVGLRQMLWGFFKKSVVADRLGITVDYIINNPSEQSGTSLLTGMLFFAFQIYCDFSGYSDIALGAAKVMGFNLMLNFNHPFRSQSISEFWRRWHISLSTWLGDYVFKPIAVHYRDLGTKALMLASMITFLISGFWHGASWRYVIWGGLHGVAFCYEIITSDIRNAVLKKLPASIKAFFCKIATFSFLIFTWIFFRANTTKDAFYIIKKISGVPAELLKIIATRKIAFLNMPGLNNQLIPCIVVLAILEIANVLDVKYRLNQTFSNRPIYIRWGLYFAGIFAIFFFGIREHRTFIYFQF